MANINALIFEQRPAHGIPEEKYYPCDEYGESLGWGGDYFLLVKKKEAHYYASGALDNKYKIVMEEGKIYFDEYIFTDFSSRRKLGKDARYEVNYNEESGLLSDQLVFIGANTEGAEEGPLEVGTIFNFSENAIQELQQGIYATDDGMSSVTLVDDKYIFDRHSRTSYRPTGNYTINNGKLTRF